MMLRTNCIVKGYTKLNLFKSIAAYRTFNTVIHRARSVMDSLCTKYVAVTLSAS